MILAPVEIHIHCLIKTAKQYLCKVGEAIKWYGGSIYQARPYEYSNVKSCQSGFKNFLLRNTNSRDGANKMLL